MKKKKSIVMPPLFRKEKDMMGIVNNPDKLKALAEIVAQANKVTDTIKECKDMTTWHSYVVSLVPQFEKREEFITKLNELVNEYCDE